MWGKVNGWVEAEQRKLPDKIMYHRSIASFITFTTYGTWLHGDDKGSIIQSEGTTKLLKPNPNFQSHQKNKLTHPPITLNCDQRKIVLTAIVEHCKVKGWQLFAVHVRSNHVHIIVCADKENFIADFKSWATRKLKEAGYVMPKVWTQGGSRQYIFKEEQLREKMDYVINQQGDMMEYYAYPGF